MGASVRKSGNRNISRRVETASGRAINWRELSTDAVVGVDLEGRIQSWNLQAERLFGYSASEVMGREISMLDRRAADGDRVLTQESLSSAVEAGWVNSVRVRKDGTPIEVSVTLSAVEDSRGKLRGARARYRKFETHSRVKDATLPRTPEPEPSVNAATRRNPVHVLGSKDYSQKRLSVLLASAAAGGTIAAVRYLGGKGMGVNVISTKKLAPAAWSHCASRSYSAPPESQVDRFVERLLAIGAANPGQVLLPTSDETAWLYTVNAPLLKQHFCLYQPSVESMRRILDKKLFEDALTRAGLDVLPSWEPRTLEEVTKIASTLPYPILIKPRTHVHRLLNNKGMVAHSMDELIEKYQAFVDREKTRAADNPLLANAGLPILQQFVSVANEGVCSVTGFIDRTGELFVTRRSTKVFQRSQPVGVGVCFEPLPDSPLLSSAVRRLCGELNYFGMFEVEFLRFEGGWAAIDFNPRLFNQVGMDIRRGMPLPLFACLDATGQSSALRAAIEKAQAKEADTKAVFCDRFTLKAILAARTLTGRISGEEREHWRSWIERNADNSVDCFADKTDLMPVFVHALSEIYLGLKSFPRFLNSMPRLAPVMGHGAVKVSQ